MLLLQCKEGAQGLLRKLFGLRAFWPGLAFCKNVLPRILCRTRAQSVLASGSQERAPGIWHRRCPVCFTQQSCRHRWPGGNNRSSLPPRKSFDTSSTESRSSSKRACPLCRNLRRRSLSTRKTSILRFKICSRADELGPTKT